MFLTFNNITRDILSKRYGIVIAYCNKILGGSRTLQKMLEIDTAAPALAVERRRQSSSSS